MLVEWTRRNAVVFAVERDDRALVLGGDVAWRPVAARAVNPRPRPAAVPVDVKRNHRLRAIRAERPRLDREAVLQEQIDRYRAPGRRTKPGVDALRPGRADELARIRCAAREEEVARVRGSACVVGNRRGQRRRRRFDDRDTFGMRPVRESVSHVRVAPRAPQFTRAFRRVKRKRDRVESACVRNRDRRTCSGRHHGKDNRHQYSFHLFPF